MDKQAVIAELKALRTRDYDVDSYVDEFNRTLSKYAMNGSDEMYLKDIFLSNLPNKVQETLQLDASVSRMTLM